MPVTVTGNYPMIERRRTGLYSLDLALSQKGKLGLPVRSLTEIYGRPNAGKSTLAYYLLASLSSTGNRVVIGDVEMLDRDYIRDTMEFNGLDGEVNIVDTTELYKKQYRPRSHEDILMEVAGKLEEEGTPAVMFDSIGAIASLSEQEGDIGEAFWGKRAKVVAQFSRKIVSALRNKETPSNAFVINHMHQAMGGRGTITPGGVNLEHASAIRLQVWTKETFVDEKTGEIFGFLVEGLVTKLRYGGKGRKFQFYIVPGIGVHSGASAMFDCFEFGLAERGSRVKMGEKSYGFLKAELLKYASEGKSLKFKPFVEALEEYEEEMKKVYSEQNSDTRPEEE